MSKEHNINRRHILKGIGALSVATPTALLASSEGNPESGESTIIEPEQEKYGIRQYAAPEIELDYWIDANGNQTQYSIKEQRGKWLFMKFFQNWCPGCHKYGFPTLQKFAEEFNDHPEVAITAIQTVFEGRSVNTKSAVRDLQLRYELPIVMGHDEGTEVTGNHPLSMINYRTGGTPWLVLVAPDGTVVYNHFHADTDSLINFVKEQVG